MEERRAIKHQEKMSERKHHLLLPSPADDVLCSMNILRRIIITAEATTIVSLR
jgi:hypothetical protein